MIADVGEDVEKEELLSIAGQTASLYSNQGTQCGQPASDPGTSLWVCTHRTYILPQRHYLLTVNAALVMTASMSSNAE